MDSIIRLINLIPFEHRGILIIYFDSNKLNLLKE